MPKKLSITLALAFAFALILCACSNSEYADYAGWEENVSTENSDSYAEEDPIVEQEKNNCFNNFRQPDLQSKVCKKQFFSHDTVTDFPQSGFFQKTFTIIFPDNKPMNCEVGGKPATKNSPEITSIQVDSSTTIRCIDFSSKSGTEIIRTYILEKAPNLPAVFITTDPGSLFDPDTGIYMEGPNAEKENPHYGANYWLDKEIPIFIELVETGASTPGFAKNAGLRIFGNYSRTNAKKSVAITFREKYGDKRLYYPLFPEFPELSMFKGFILRNNGQNFQNDYIRDRLASSISEGLGVDYQRGRFAIVYYNGNYFGIHDLRERSNEYYFETHYGISKKNINLLRANNQTSAGTSTDFVALTNWIIRHDLADDNNYATISSQIDIYNYINYMQTEMFVDNRDWPGNNQKKWNCISPKTPWKWLIYDTDLSFGYVGNNNSSNIFDYASTENGGKMNSPSHTFLFRNLLRNNDFKEAFVNRMTALLQINFEVHRIITRIEKMMAEIKTEIPRDQQYWSLDANRMNNKLESIKRFTTERPSIIIRQLRDYFNLGDPISVTLAITGQGTILVHEIPLEASSTTITFCFLLKSTVLLITPPDI